MEHVREDDYLHCRLYFQMHINHIMRQRLNSQKRFKTNTFYWT